MTEQKIDKPIENKEIIKKRVPVFKQKGYDYSNIKMDKENFHYHWVNGNTARMNQFMKAGYTQVMDSKSNPISRKGKQDEFSQYLMCIKMEDYRKDQEIKLDEPREIETLIKKGNVVNKDNKTSDTEMFYGKTKDVKVVLGKEG